MDYIFDSSDEELPDPRLPEAQDPEVISIPSSDSEECNGPSSVGTEQASAKSEPPERKDVVPESDSCASDSDDMFFTPTKSQSAGDKTSQNKVKIPSFQGFEENCGTSKNQRNCSANLQLTKSEKANPFGDVNTLQSRFLGPCDEDSDDSCSFFSQVSTIFEKPKKENLTIKGVSSVSSGCSKSTRNNEGELTAPKVYQTPIQDQIQQNGTKTIPVSSSRLLPNKKNEALSCQPGESSPMFSLTADSQSSLHSDNLKTVLMLLDKALETHSEGRSGDSDGGREAVDIKPLNQSSGRQSRDQLEKNPGSTVTVEISESHPVCGTAVVKTEMEEDAGGGDDVESNSRAAYQVTDDGSLYVFDSDDEEMFLSQMIQHGSLESEDLSNNQNDDIELERDWNDDDDDWLAGIDCHETEDVETNEKADEGDCHQMLIHDDYIDKKSDNQHSTFNWQLKSESLFRAGEDQVDSDDDCNNHVDSLKGEKIENVKFSQQHPRDRTSDKKTWCNQEQQAVSFVVNDQAGTTGGQTCREKKSEWSEGRICSDTNSQTAIGDPYTVATQAYMFDSDEANPFCQQTLANEPPLNISSSQNIKSIHKSKGRRDDYSHSSNDYDPFCIPTQAVDYVSDDNDPFCVPTLASESPQNNIKRTKKRFRSTVRSSDGNHRFNHQDPFNVATQRISPTSSSSEEEGDDEPFLQQTLAVETFSDKNYCSDHEDPYSVLTQEVDLDGTNLNSLSSCKGAKDVQKYEDKHKSKDNDVGTATQMEAETDNYENDPYLQQTQVMDEASTSDEDPYCPHEDKHKSKDNNVGTATQIEAETDNYENDPYLQQTQVMDEASTSDEDPYCPHEDKHKSKDNNVGTATQIEAETDNYENDPYLQQTQVMDEASTSDEDPYCPHEDKHKSKDNNVGTVTQMEAETDNYENDPYLQQTQVMDEASTSDEDPYCPHEDKHKSKDNDVGTATQIEAETDNYENDPYLQQTQVMDEASTSDEDPYCPHEDKHKSKDNNVGTATQIEAETDNYENDPYLQQTQVMDEASTSDEDPYCPHEDKHKSKDNNVGTVTQMEAETDNYENDPYLQQTQVMDEASTSDEDPYCQNTQVVGSHNLHESHLIKLNRVKKLGDTSERDGKKRHSSGYSLPPSVYLYSDDYEGDPVETGNEDECQKIRHPKAESEVSRKLSGRERKPLSSTGSEKEVTKKSMGASLSTGSSGNRNNKILLPSLQPSVFLSPLPSEPTADKSDPQKSYNKTHTDRGHKKQIRVGEEGTSLGKRIMDGAKSDQEKKKRRKSINKDNEVPSISLSEFSPPAVKTFNQSIKQAGKDLIQTRLPITESEVSHKLAMRENQGLSTTIAKDNASRKSLGRDKDVVSPTGANKEQTSSGESKKAQMSTEGGMKGASRKSFRGEKRVKSVESEKSQNQKALKRSKIAGDETGQSKNKRRRGKKSSDIENKLKTRIEIAKFDMQKRQEKSSGHTNIKCNASVNNRIENHIYEDAPIPSTQEILNLRLPIMNEILPVNKRLLARGLPSRELGIFENEQQQSHTDRHDEVKDKTEVSGNKRSLGHTQGISLKSSSAKHSHDKQDKTVRLSKEDENKFVKPSWQMQSESEKPSKTSAHIHKNSDCGKQSRDKKSHLEKASVSRHHESVRSSEPAQEISAKASSHRQSHYDKRPARTQSSAVKPSADRQDSPDIPSASMLNSSGWLFTNKQNFSDIERASAQRRDKDDKPSIFKHHKSDKPPAQKHDNIDGDESLARKKDYSHRQSTNKKEDSCKPSASIKDKSASASVHREDTTDTGRSSAGKKGDELDNTVTRLSVHKQIGFDSLSGSKVDFGNSDRPSGQKHLPKPSEPLNERDNIFSILDDTKIREHSRLAKESVLNKPSQSISQPPRRSSMPDPSHGGRSVAPSVAPSLTPSGAQSVTPSVAPSVAPSLTPSGARSVTPSVASSEAPPVTPSGAPSVAASVAPLVTPSGAPSLAHHLLTAQGNPHQSILKKPQRPDSTDTLPTNSNIGTRVSSDKTRAHKRIVFDESRNRVRTFSPPVTQYRQVKQSVHRHQNDTPKGPLNNGQTINFKKDLIHAVLKWNPSWLEEYRLKEQQGRKPNAIPPLLGEGKGDCQQLEGLRLFYDSSLEYAQKFSNILKLETWQGIFAEWKTVLKNKCPSRKNTVISLQRIHCENEVGLNDNPSEIHTFRMEGVCSDPHLMLCSGDILLLSAKNEQVKTKSNQTAKNQFAYLKSIRKINPERLGPDAKRLFFTSGHVTALELQMETKQRLVSFSMGSLSAEKLCSLVSDERQMKVLNSLQHNQFLKQLVGDPSRHAVRHIFYHNNIKDRPHPTLNTEQARAVFTIRDAVMSPAEKVFLLQGPPGTGKSHTIMALVHEILQVSNFNKRICLATPSNAAIDELAKRIINFSQKCLRAGKSGIKMVRIGKGFIDHNIRPYSLDSMSHQKAIEVAQGDAPESVKKELKIFSEKIKNVEKCLATSGAARRASIEAKRKKLRKTLENLKPKPSGRHYAMAERLVLQESHVICGTMSSFGQPRLHDTIANLDRGNPFGCIIVDEATQAKEVECLIPMQFNCTKVVLVGDQEQLQPTILSREAKEKELGRSLFTRLHLCLTPSEEEGGRSEPILSLRRQYRMADAILQFPNEAFYRGNLFTDEVVKRKRSANPYKLAQYLVFDIRDTMEREADSMSTINPLEAKCAGALCDLVNQAIKRTADKQNRIVCQERIGVICPYSQQKRAIERELQTKELRRIAVETVDAFQGQEKDAIIMSCVRAQKCPSTVGFLEEQERMNVSLTRARQAFYILGNFKTLKINPLWRALYDNAQSRGLLVTVPLAKDFYKIAEDKVKIR